MPCMCQLLDEVIAALGATKSKGGVTSDLSQALVPHGTLLSAPPPGVGGVQPPLKHLMEPGSHV